MLRLKNLNPYERHKLIINEYILNQPGKTQLMRRDTSRDKRDIDVIKENHRFLWDEEDTANTWEAQLAKKYYDKLFKEYCISDLSRYKENKIALRWRVEKEVITGKGQFICGNKICNQTQELRSWEVNFAYSEQGERKNALVKLRLCPDCSVKLNYHSKKKEVKRIKKNIKKSSRKINSSKSKNDSESSSEDEGDKSILKDDTKVSDSERANSDDERGRLLEMEKKLEKQTENIWANRKEDVEEPSREDEFEKYLEDLLL